MSTPQPDPLILPAHTCAGTCGRLVAEASKGSRAWRERDADANAHILPNAARGMCSKCDIADRTARQGRLRAPGPARPSDEENLANLEVWAARRRHIAATARRRRRFYASHQRLAAV